MLTVKETAEKLNVSESTVYGLIAANRLTCHRVGLGRGVIRITPEAVQEFLDANVSITATQRKPNVPRPKLKHIKL